MKLGSSLNTPKALTWNLVKRIFEFLSSSNLKQMEREGEEDEVDEASSKPHIKLQILTLDREKMEERRRKVSRANPYAGMSGNELIGVHLNLYNPYLHKTPSYFYYLHFESNEDSFDPILGERVQVFYGN